MAEIRTLKLDYHVSGRTFTVYPVLIADENDVVMIDCGYPGQLSNLQKQAKEQGIDLHRLTKVIITHNDIDHMGSLADLKWAYPHIEIIASHLQAQYISGEKMAIRLQLAQHAYATAQEHRKGEIQKLIQILNSVELVRVDRRVSNRQIIDVCGGIQIIYTPGHLPGHISVYHIPSRSLITGDALISSFGKIDIAHPKSNLDSALARKTGRSLSEWDIESLYCYHGGKVEGDIREQLKSL
jgi:glyoxylase-like metal-dependent hydrolase (beta-lactamase superfamily II)